MALVLNTQQMPLNKETKPNQSLKLIFRNENSLKYIFWRTNFFYEGESKVCNILMIACSVYNTWLNQFKPQKIPAEFDIMVVGVLTYCALLHSIWMLYIWTGKCCLIQQLRLYMYGKCWGSNQKHLLCKS